MYYGYAEGIDVTHKLAAGKLIAAPWGCASRRLLAPRWERIEFTDKTLTPLGTQGSHPPHARELELRKTGEKLEEYIRALGPFPPRRSVIYDRDSLLTMIRDYYFFWSSYEELLAPVIRQRHKAFFDWLLDINFKPVKR